MKLKNTLVSFAKFAIAAGIISFMVFKYHEGISTAFKNINGFWLFISCLLYFFHLTVGAFRWQLLLKVQGIKIHFREALALLMIGNFSSLVIPGGAIGGDIPKAAFLAARTPPGGKMKGVFTILVDRIIGMVALFSLAGVCGLLCFRTLRELGSAIEIAVWAVIAGCLIAAAAAIALFFHRKIEKIGFIASLLKYADAKTKGALSNLMNAMDAFRENYAAIIFCLLVSIIFVHLNIAFIIFCISKGIGVSVSDLLLFLLVATLGNAAGALPLTPAGVGTRDIIMQNLFKAIGISGGNSAAIPIIFTMLVLVFNLSGGLFLIFSDRVRNSQFYQNET